MRPLVFLFWCKISQTFFKTLTHNFSLAISLWMVRCAHFHPKFTSESGTTVRLIEVGMPWIFKIFYNKIWATTISVKGCWIAQKWAYLESQSTTTMMTNLLPSFGRLAIKSIEMYFHSVAGIGIGCKVLGFFIILSLFHW